MSDDDEEEDFECPQCQSMLGIPVDITSFDCPICEAHIEFELEEEEVRLFFLLVV